MKRRLRGVGGVLLLTVDKMSMNSKLFLFYPGRSEIINWGSDESFRRATWTITKAVTKYGGHSKESGRCYKTKKKALTCKEEKCTGVYFLEGIFAGYRWLRRKLIALLCAFLKNEISWKVHVINFVGLRVEAATYVFYFSLVYTTQVSSAFGARLLASLKVVIQ